MAHGASSLIHPVERGPSSPLLSLCSASVGKISSQNQPCVGVRVCVGQQSSVRLSSLLFSKTTTTKPDRICSLLDKPQQLGEMCVSMNEQDEGQEFHNYWCHQLNVARFSFIHSSEDSWPAAAAATG